MQLRVVQPYALSPTAGPDNCIRPMPKALHDSFGRDSVHLSGLTGTRIWSCMSHHWPSQMHSTSAMHDLNMAHKLTVNIPAVSRVARA